MSKHTQGPWLFSPSGAVMQGYSQPFAVAEAGKPNLIAGCFGDVSGGMETAEANARLIAAAPDLLDYARAAESREAGFSVPWNIDGSGHRCEWCADCVARLTHMRRVAVSKAEGRSS